LLAGIYSIWDVWLEQKRVEELGRRTSQEAVELDEELEVDIVALGRFAMRAPHVMPIEIDTWMRRE